MGHRLTLASASPRRRALLEDLEVEGGVAVAVAAVDETPAPQERPAALVDRLARAKAAAIAASTDGVVLGADTVVVIDTLVGPRALGKPRDHDDALRLLRLQRGRTVRVVSGVAVVDGTGAVASVTTTTGLTIGEPTDEELAAYVATGEGDDKAGALSVQGGAAGFVDAIHGCWTNVLGLPVCSTIALLTRAGIEAAGTCTTREGDPCPELPVVAPRLRRRPRGSPR